MRQPTTDQNDSRAIVPRARLREALTMLFGILMLSAIAFYNHYPLIFADTGGYLLLRNTGIRSAFYGFFVAPAHLTHTLWTVVFMQSLLTLLMLRPALREVFAIRSRIQFLVIVAILSLATSLPWFTGFIMPDVFAPLMVIGLFLLAFCFERLRRGERVLVVALTFFSIIVHYSNVPIAIGLWITAAIAYLVMRRRGHAAVPHLAMPAALIVIGVISIVASNYLMLGIATFSPGGYAFIMARLIDHGTAVEYLRESCRTRHWAACAYLDRMPMAGEDFLWKPDGLFMRHGFIAPREEGLEIVTGTIEEFPIRVARDALTDAMLQLTSVRTGNGLRAAAINPSGDAIKVRYPAEYQAYLNSHQGRGEFTRRRQLWELHLNFLIICAFYTVFIAMLLAHDGQWLPIEFFLTVALTVLLNAFVTGALSEPTNRYGSRIIWLVPLMAIASWRHALGLSASDEAQSQ